MKEYSITITIKVEAEEADFDKIEIFSEKLSEKIMDDLNHRDIEIVDIIVDSIDDFNDYDIDMGEEFSDYDE